MLGKRKLCTGCKTEQFIWKSDGRDKYCKQCWGKTLTKSPTLPTYSRIKTVSTKKKEQDAEYSKQRLIFLDQFAYCQVNYPQCTEIATEIHHMAGRGVYYLDTSTWKSICHNCHKRVTEHSQEAIELGHSISRNKIAA